MNPYDHLESEKNNREKRKCLIYNKKCLCEHSSLHPMISIKGRYIPINEYNHMKEKFIKIGDL